MDWILQLTAHPTTKAKQQANWKSKYTDQKEIPTQISALKMP